MPYGPKSVFSIVIPVYNEEATLPILFHRIDRLLEAIGEPAEVILVDDGSKDTTGIFAAARAARDPRYRYLALSRNFGHQVAISAGMDFASGDAVIIMDADLQDPPELVLELIARWREGFEIVNARRLSRDGETWLKRGTAALFYRLMRRLTAVDIPADVGDFRLVDRRVVEAFRAMPERDRFVRGMFGWMGFRQTEVAFHRLPRVSGASKYNWARMLKLAADGIVGFSDVPLRFALWAGTLVSLAGIGLGTYFAIGALMGAHYVSGWTSTIVLVTLLSGVNLLMTGVVGVYVGRIHTEVKNRPLYVVGRAVGFDASDGAKREAGSDGKADAA